MSLGPLPSRDPTLHHYVHQRAPGTYGVGDPLPPQHYDYMGVHGPNPQTQQGRLPSIRDVETGTYPGLPPMSHLVRLTMYEARTMFVRARAAALPHVTQEEHDRVFQQQWHEQLRRSDAGFDDFAQRIWAGIVPGVPPMPRLVGMRRGRAREIYVGARESALPHAPDAEHEHAFRVQWVEQEAEAEAAPVDAPLVVEDREADDKTPAESRRWGWVATD
ncbi:MAG: hypothetical protein Q9173_002385 [Seirophora scorigena]